MAKREDPAETVSEGLARSAGTLFDGGADTLREGAADEKGAYLGAFERFRDYSVVGHLSSFGAESDIHIVERAGERWILKLYRRGVEPKLEVLRKIEALSRRHPEELVRIQETGYDERSGRWFEIQEYATLGTLKDYLAKRKPSGKTGPRTFFNAVIREIADSLAVLHENDILHLDLKPGNVLVRSTRPLDLVLTDFGVASLLDPELSKKYTASRGTPMYQSPESVAGSMGRASDWWWLGMIALEIASGEHPFRELSYQAIFGILTTKPIEIPDSLSDDCKELLRGLLTRDMKKRWGLEQVNRWLAGERGIPVYYEEPTEFFDRKTTVKPFAFMGEEFRDPSELAVACSRSEEAWNKGRALLLRGNIRAWLEREGEYEQALDLDTLIEKVKDEDEMMFRFVHSFGKELPLVFMGKSLTLNNLYLFLGKHAKRESQDKGAEKIATLLLAGGLKPILDFYMGIHGKTKDLEELRQVSNRMARKSPEDAFSLLDVYMRLDEYYCPFLGEGSSSSVVLKALASMKMPPWTRERWQGFTTKFIVPRALIEPMGSNAEDYERILSGLEERVREDLLVPRDRVSAEEQEKLTKEPLDYYEKEAFKLLWGYDEEVVSLLSFLSKATTEGEQSNDVRYAAGSALVRAYAMPYMQKKTKLSPENRALLFAAEKELGRHDLTESLVGSIIERMSGNQRSSEMYGTAIQDYRNRISDYEQRIRAEEAEKGEGKKRGVGAIFSRSGLLWLVVVLIAAAPDICPKLCPEIWKIITGTDLERGIVIVAVLARVVLIIMAFVVSIRDVCERNTVWGVIREVVALSFSNFALFISVVLSMSIYFFMMLGGPLFRAYAYMLLYLQILEILSD